MAPLIEVLLVCLVTFVGALALGAIPFMKRFGTVGPHLEDMTGLAAGFLIGAAMLVAIPEGMAVMAHGQTDVMHDYYSVGMALLVGFLVMMVLEGFGFGHDIHEEHHDHSVAHGHDHVNHPTSSALPAVIGLTIHAFIDGMVIGAALAEGETRLTITMVIVIMMHKFPAAFSISAFSLRERRDRARSRLDLLMFAAATPIAVILFWGIFSGLSETMRGLALLFSAGTFIYIATVDVLPAMHVRSRSRRVVSLVVMGILVLFVLSTITHMFLGDVH